MGTFGKALGGFGSYLACAPDIREFLIQTLSKTGGHLGPNLGVVELTLARP